jgi:RNA polymerase sigma-70 factor (ECF subfamily)
MIFVVCACLGLVPFVHVHSQQRDDGQPDGKKSLGGSGPMARFTSLEANVKISGLKLHGSRYGTPESPQESFLIYFLNDDMSEILRTEMAPYSRFERGPGKMGGAEVLASA